MNMLRSNNSNTFLLRRIITYVFSGFSFIFIGYIVMNILTTYPPSEIGVSP